MAEISPGAGIAAPQACRIDRLSNGITVISEHIPHVRSVALGVWITAGSRSENQVNNGAAHFLEHMMFKSTERRDSRQIARRLESLGGNLNAYTAKEQTCYYAEFLDEHLGIAVDLLADILNRREFDAAELEKERQVILDEIQALEDAPDEMVQDFFIEHLFPEHPLGAPILGRPETVSGLRSEDLLDFYQTHYCGASMLIVAAGNLSHDELVEMCEENFSFVRSGEEQQTSPPLSIGSGEYIIERPIHQAHICMGVPGIAYGDAQRYDLLLLNTILGGGMGSRLFQNIREKHGLAYGIYSFYDFFRDSGVFGAYLGTDRQNTGLAISLLEEEFAMLRNIAVAESELGEAKSQLKGNLVIGLESTARRMNRLAMMALYVGEIYPIDHIIERIDRVTRETLLQTSTTLLSEDRIMRVIYSPHAVGHNGNSKSGRIS